MYSKEKLKQVLAEQDRSVAYLGRVLGISTQHIHRKVNGQCPFRLEDVTKIGKALNLSDSQVFDIFLKEV